MEFRKPHWLFLDASRDEEMKYGLFNYAPLAHYDLRIQELEDELEELGDDDLMTDGGRPRKYFFTWMTENGNLLYEASVNGDGADVLYESEEEAEEALERLIDAHPEEEDRYRKSNLYKVKRMDKIMEGVEVMTEQQGLGDFATDGGYREDILELAEAAEEVEW